MNLEQIQMVHEQIAGGDMIGAANLACAADGLDVTITTKAEAFAALKTLEKNLADARKWDALSVLLWGNEMFDARPSVVKDVFKAVTENHKLIIMGGSSLSKCLGPDVKVMMFNGTTKAAKDIKAGDVLMGDDSKRRNVLAAHSGRGQMYRITPERGEPWTCNDEHILSLRFSTTKMCGGSKEPSSYRIKGQVIDISVKDYLKLSKNFKNSLRMFHVGVDFPERPLPFDAYIYGAWLGDGCTTMPMLHTPDGPMAARWRDYWNSFPGMKCVKMKGPNERCSSWRASKNTTAVGVNVFSEFIKTTTRPKEKFILDKYLFNSRENRLKLLAGLLDADGWLEGGDKTYGFVSKWEGLTRQVSWLARSLGFASKVTSRIHTIKSIGFSGVYWHTRVSGKGISEIPSLEKPAQESTSFKTMTNTGFKIEPIGEGDYNGFLIDGNHRFLLGDFTVTHNTFSCGVYYYLSWRTDPYWTSVKLAAPSEDHLYTNLFSHLVALHKASVLPITENDRDRVKVNESDLFISMVDALPEMRIQGLLCKPGSNSAGSLRGHKPKPYRTEKHPVYGKWTRLFILIDECTSVPEGAFNDIKTTEASIDPTMDNIKIVMACNPEGVDYKIVKMAEPEAGWDVDQVDELYRWISKLGYPVLRLDGKNFENVVERRVVYRGMLSYDTYLSFLKAGENSGEYWAKGRGFPPLKDNAWTVIPPAWMQSQRGEPIFTGAVKDIAIVDTALGGSDKALFGIARFGEAAGWRKNNGETEWFVNRANVGQKIKKHCAVLDQIIQLQKSSLTVDIVAEVMGRCNELRIPPEQTVLDATGNAAGVWSHATKFWGNVLGVEFGKRASEALVLAEDKLSSYDMYDGKATELVFAVKRWLEPTVGALYINPIISPHPLFTQATTRRYHNVKGGKVKVEPKEIYKARNGNVSPDEFDILQLLVEWCRERGGYVPGVQESNKDGKRDKEDREKVSLLNADEPETLGTEAKWQPNRLSAEE